MSRFTGSRKSCNTNELDHNDGQSDVLVTYVIMFCNPWCSVIIKTYAMDTRDLQISWKSFLKEQLHLLFEVFPQLVVAADGKNNGNTITDQKLKHRSRYDG